MRQLLVFIISLVFFHPTSEKRAQQFPVKLEPKPIKELVVEPEVSVKIPTRDISDLVDAMIWVESRGKEDAYARGENAVGVLQIRPIMVNEVNRLLNKQKSDKFYTLDDRWSEEKSIEMFYVIYDYYHKTSSYEKIARCWNGGPKGLQKKQTKKYWRKVQKRLYKNENSSDWESEV